MSLILGCLATPEDISIPGQMWALREVRSLICSYLHQVFITDTFLVKLVHFQVSYTIPMVGHKHYFCFILIGISKRTFRSNSSWYTINAYMSGFYSRITNPTLY